MLAARIRTLKNYFFQGEIMRAQSFTSRAYYVLGLFLAAITNSAKSANVVELDNLDKGNCLNQVSAPIKVDSNPHQLNFLIGAEGCPFFNASKPFFAEACESLPPPHACFTFTAWNENPPTSIESAELEISQRELVVITLFACLGMRTPSVSPSLMMTIGQQGTFPHNNHTSVLINDPVVLKPIPDNTTAADFAGNMTDFYNTFVNPGRATHRHHQNEQGQLMPNARFGL